MHQNLEMALEKITGLDIDFINQKIEDAEIRLSRYEDPSKFVALLSSVGCSVRSIEVPEGANSISRVLKTLKPNRTYLMLTRARALAVIDEDVFDPDMMNRRTSVFFLFEVVAVAPPATKGASEHVAVKPATLSLNDLLERLADLPGKGMGHRKIRLRIERGTVAMGAGHSVDVVGITPGLDWQSGTLYLETSEPLGIADEKLSLLGQRVTQSAELIYRLGSILKDEKISAERKVELMQGWVDKYRQKD